MHYGCLYISHYSAAPAGNTIESRESRLNTEIAKGKRWSIVKEIELDGFIISAAYSADNKSALAIFKSTGNGNYKFVTSTNRDNDEIIIGGITINDDWYDLFWLHGVQTEYAEITYTINGQKQDPLRYDTTDMGIICCKNNAKDYEISVCYYDSSGNKYE